MTSADFREKTRSSMPFEGRFPEWYDHFDPFKRLHANRNGHYDRTANP